jgi:hypothetical protein
MEASFTDESMTLNAFNSLQRIIRGRWIVGYFIKSKQFLRLQTLIYFFPAEMNKRLPDSTFCVINNLFISFSQILKKGLYIYILFIKLLCDLLFFVLKYVFIYI